ncbi:hypothetical protein [Endozoicomonas ascidiicola]|uniref:hypothetical protein n=1 Tax=Endozoicomonas ascidiicola TaxID=1698521 RepID=UPI00082CB0A1|nr:hypothetical protein [Endozoicomonas ascidiicola]
MTITTNPINTTNPISTTNHQDHLHTVIQGSLKARNHNCHCHIDPENDLASLIKFVDCESGKTQTCKNLNIKLTPIADIIPSNPLNNQTDLIITAALNETVTKLKNIVLGHRDIKKGFYDLEVEYQITCLPAIPALS